jgi:hypothetical protein
MFRNIQRYAVAGALWLVVGAAVAGPGVYASDVALRLEASAWDRSVASAVSDRGQWESRDQALAAAPAKVGAATFYRTELLSVMGMAAAGPGVYASEVALEPEASSWDRSEASAMSDRGRWGARDQASSAALAKVGAATFYRAELFVPAMSRAPGVY